MMTDDDQAEYAAALADAWERTSRAALAATELGRILRDAQQAGREWATWKLDEAEHVGLMAQVKAARKVTIVSKRGNVATVVGIRRNDEWVQMEMELLTPQEARDALALRLDQRRAADRNAWALRHVVALCDRHPDAATVADALTAEGVSLAELLAA